LGIITKTKTQHNGNFLNSFFYDTMESGYSFFNEWKIASVSYRLPADLFIENISSRREEFGYIIEKIKKNEFPKRFNNLVDNNKWNIKDKYKNISAINRKESMLNDALFVFIDKKAYAGKTINKFINLFSNALEASVNDWRVEKCIEQLMLCYSSNNGYEYYEDHVNILCNNGDVVSNDFYAN